MGHMQFLKLHPLFEDKIKFDEELFVCFEDFEKAFDRVKWTKLFGVLKKIRCRLERQKTYHEFIHAADISR